MYVYYIYIYIYTSVDVPPAVFGRWRGAQTYTVSAGHAHRPPRQGHSPHLPREFQRFGFENHFRAGGFSDLG